MRLLLIFFVSINVFSAGFISAQEVYPAVTLNDRRAALFSASRSKMFDPSANWSDARTTVGQRAGSSDAGGGQMLETLGQSSTLETIRANPMNMFLTVGGRLQGLMAIDTQGETEIIDSLEGTDLGGLTTDDVNAGRAAELVNSTGLYTPRFAKPDQDSPEQVRFQEQLKASIENRQIELSQRLNEKFGLNDDAQIKLTIIQGVAFLQGTVDSKDHRKIAEIFVGFEPGIIEVRNELKVVSP